MLKNLDKVSLKKYNECLDNLSKPLIVYKNIRLAAFITFAVVLLSACASNPTAPKITADKKKPAAERAMLHTQLARGYMNQEQYATAKQELEKALLLDPSHSDSNYVMGLLMIKLNNTKDAAYYLERAVETDSENSAAAHDFGMLLCQTGKEARSVKYFEIAASNPLFDRSELSYMRAGECLARINDKRAEAYLRKSLSTNPRLRPALYRLALLKKDNGQYLNARAYIERFMAITKPQPDALYLAYQIESKLKAYDVAEGYRKRILENFPGSKEAELLRDVPREES